MNLSLLDNPIWHALNSHHRHLAIRGDTSVRYQSDVAKAAAMPENNTAGFDDLASLVGIDDIIALIGEPLPENLTGWQVLQDERVSQMICEHLRATDHVSAVQLTGADVPEMLDLVALAEPGPLLPRTIEMGLYLGLRQDRRLVAMAGQRLHLEGFCEISSVCTHPDYRGRGYASALTAMLAEAILERQETPFLHVLSANHVAVRLYGRLGFHQRREIPLPVLKRLA